MSVSTDSLVSVTRPGSGKDRSLVGILQADWRGMYDHEESKDMELVVGPPHGEESFRVHSLVMVARCDRLKGRMSNGNTPNTKMVLEHLAPFAVKKILQYLYSAELEITDALDIVPLQIAAYEFGLPNLRSYFIQCLEYLLMQTNVCKVLTNAHSCLINGKNLEEDLQHDLWCTIDSCLQFVVRHLKGVMASDTVVDLDKDSLKLVVSSKLPISNQEMLKSILRWGRLKAGTNKVLQSEWTDEEKKAVRGHIEEIIPHVQLADGRPISPDSITDGVYGILERYSWAESCSLSSEERFPESVILNDRHYCAAKTVSDWCGHGGQWLLLYRASTDGFSAKHFHSRCDNNGPTLTIVVSTSGHIFGGFTDISWSSRYKRGKYSSSHHSFLFSLFNSSVPSQSPVKYSIRQPSYAINSHPHYGPIFGSGADLCISSNCCDNEDSYSRIPSSYGDDHTHPYSLTGTVYFRVKDYEVFIQQT